MTTSYQQLAECLRGRLNSPLWRLNHLYWIENKQGQMQRFSMNEAQLRLHRNLWARNAVLKARQLGISTYVAIYMLDSCLFTPGFHAGIVDKTLPDAELKLEKIRFAWEHLDYLPPGSGAQERALAFLGGLVKQHSAEMRNGSPVLPTDARSRLAFANGSDVRLGTTMRGGTLSLLHVSELAHTAVHAPRRAREVLTGAINSVPLSGRVILESTHEGGRFGVNYELMCRAMENRARRVLSPLDFRFFFFSWFDNPEYALPGESPGEELREYFAQLETEQGVRLSPAQQAWYARMSRTMGAAMRWEYPSSPQEAFNIVQEGAIYAAQLMRLRESGRIGADFPFHPHAPLYSAWDLGMSDHTAIWLVQVIGGQIYWLQHYAANQLPLEHYAGKIREWEREFGPFTAHFLPHDAAHRDPHGQSYVASLARLGINAVRVVPRTTDVWRGINDLRRLLEYSWFHRNTLLGRLDPTGHREPSGLDCLENYRTAPPSASGSCREAPLHDAFSHSADAARTFAEAASHGFLTPLGSHRPSRARME